MLSSAGGAIESFACPRDAVRPATGAGTPSDVGVALFLGSPQDPDADRARCPVAFHVQNRFHLVAGLRRVLYISGSANSTHLNSMI